MICHFKQLVVKNGKPKHYTAISNIAYYRNIRNCFFTGIKMILLVRKEEEIDDTSPNVMLSPSIEHLIPSYMTKHRDIIEYNMVLACRFVNNMIDTAPISIKFGLKEFLSTFECNVKAPKKVISFYEKKINEYLDQFAVVKKGEKKPKRGVYGRNYYPWDWQNFMDNNVELGHECLRRYVMMLSTEEMKLFFKYHRNVLDQLQDVYPS